jgi:formylglycine-generating enzyme required for sulfatase activity
MSKIRPEVAKRRIESFDKRFGKAHLYLAYHAAFPLSLTPDLLYRLWANFQRDIRGEVLSIPWIAVADLLLSSLCDEVGHELYEMNVVVRNLLLSRLKEDEKFGQQRIYQLSNFLLDYIRQQLQSDDPDIRDFAQAQRWIALAYMPTQASEAVQELALALSGAYQNDRSDLVRLASLVETLAEPLGGLEEFQPLLIYARGMKKFAGGDLEAATNELGTLGEGNKIRVAGISLPIPKQIKATNLSRRQILQYLGWGSIGLGLAVIGGRQFQTQVQSSSQQPSQPTPSPQPTPEQVSLQTVQFQVVTVDGRGNITNRRPSQANFFTEDLGNGMTLDMVEIPGGQFVMGSPPTEKQRDSDEGPQHTVTIQSFFMGRFAVTQEQYQAVMGDNPSRSKGARRPVENISWDQASEFCDRLAQRTKKSYRYRLPSEAEWEYACRAGTTTPFHYGETITSSLANYNGDSTYSSEPKGKDRQETTNVGSFPPNAFGLYDMHGNVWEWCLDTWHDNYNGAPTDGSAWINENDNQIKLLRGGSWDSNPWDCRSAYRNGLPRGNWLGIIGFRVVVAALRSS